MARRSSSNRSSSNRSSAPSRQAPAASKAPAPVQQQAAPPAVAQPQSSGGGFLSGVAQIATGSVIGHGISNMLFGGRSHDQPPPPQQQPVQSDAAPGSYDHYAATTAPNACDPDQKAFMKCLEANPSNVSACQFYLDMLNQCKAEGKRF